MRISSYRFDQKNLIDLWLAWYTGTVEHIHDMAKYDNDYSQYDEKKVKKHFPVAKMIASKYSQLLFNEPITVKFKSNATTERFTLIQKDTMMNTTLKESAEMQSALGGVALKINLDTMEEYPILSYYSADSFEVVNAVWGKVREIYFYSLVKFEKGFYYVIRENHSISMKNRMASVGDEVIILEEEAKTWTVSTELLKMKNLSNEKDAKIIPLESIPETENMQAIVDSEEPTFFYFGINTPNKLSGSIEGISDFHDAIDTFIEIDQAMTSLYNDLLIGFGRLMLDADMLDAQYDADGKFTGYKHDYNKNLYSMVDGLEKPEKVQFDIRFDEHLQGIDSLVKQAITQSRLSPSSFGYDSGAVQKTATEVKSNERNSYSTKLSRQVEWEDVLIDTFTALIEFDNTMNSLNNDSTVEKIRFSDSIADDIAVKRSEIGAAIASGVISQMTGIKELNPEWTEKQVLSEVARIQGVDDAFGNVE